MKNLPGNLTIGVLVVIMALCAGLLARKPLLSTLLVAAMAALICLLLYRLADRCSVGRREQ